MASLLDLAGSRRGHFVMESGLHSAVWFDLEGLFDEAGIAPFVDQLATSLESYQVDVVCGPATGGAKLAALLAGKLGCAFTSTELLPAEPAGGLFKARYALAAECAAAVRDQRVALVDDVMSAGSSLRATLAEVEAHGGRAVVVGALHVLGGAGVDFFLQRGLTVETTGRGAFEMWPPDRCPLCAAGAPLDRIGH